MKTTIDIADDLIDRARVVQKRDDVTLRTLVEEGLRLVLDKHAKPVKPYKFVPVVAGSPYKPGMPVPDVTAILHETYVERDARVFPAAQRHRVAESPPEYKARSAEKRRKRK